MDRLIGGDSSNHFDFSYGYSLIGSLLGGSGFNDLHGPALSNTWNITAQDQGTIPALSDMPFANIGFLLGGVLDDTFVFADGVGLSSGIDGGGDPMSNGLDYSAFTQTARLYPTTPCSGTASNLGRDYINICNFIGNVEIGD